MKTRGAGGYPWLNYQHLLYFYVVAKEGGLAAASRRLKLSHPTLSKQIRQLENVLGQQLFSRDGRSLTLTAAGHAAYSYAHEIFSLGEDFVNTLGGEEPVEGYRPRLVVGVTPVMPKLIVRQLLQPVFKATRDVRLTVVEDEHERLLARIALHELDLVLADAPVPPGSPVRAFNHPLGNSPLTFFASPALELNASDFPHCLDGEPFILPTRGTAVRRVLEPWFRAQDVAPFIAAEIEDIGLVKTMGQAGVGVFVAPTLVEEAVCGDFGVMIVGRTESVREHFYAITMSRRIKHPAVAEIREVGRTLLGG